MASIAAIIAAADRYTFFQDMGQDGVALAGKLGTIAVFHDGNVEEASTTPGYPTYPGHTDKIQLAKAQAFAGSLLEQ